MIKLVKYGAPWCGPCVAMEESLERAKDEFPDLCIERVNVEDERYTKDIAELKIRAIPTLIGFKDGVVISRNTGLISYPLLKEIITNLMEAQNGKGSKGN